MGNTYAKYLLNSIGLGINSFSADINDYINKLNNIIPGHALSSYKLSKADNKNYGHYIINCPESCYISVTATTGENNIGIVVTDINIDE